jgi:hypothetical protein
MKFEFRTAGCGGGAPGFKSKPLTAGTQMVPACQIRDGVGHTRQMEQHGHYKTEKSSMRSVRLCDSILDCCRVDSILAQGERQRVQLAWLPLDFAGDGMLPTTHWLYWWLQGNCIFGFLRDDLRRRRRHPQRVSCPTAATTCR